MDKRLYKRVALFLLVLVLAGCLLATQSYGRTHSDQLVAQQATVGEVPQAGSVWAVLALIVAGAAVLLVIRRKQPVSETQPAKTRTYGGRSAEGADASG